MRKYSIEANLVLGSTMTLNEVIDVLENVGNKDIYYKYLLQMRRHFDLIAHVPLRDVSIINIFIISNKKQTLICCAFCQIATIGGNLYLKYIHNDFPSDVFLLFETVNASLTIGN